jgi:hypothetical protein
MAAFSALFSLSSFSMIRRSSTYRLSSSSGFMRAFPRESSATCFSSAAFSRSSLFIASSVLMCAERNCVDADDYASEERRCRGAQSSGGQPHLLS